MVGICAVCIFSISLDVFDKDKPSICIDVHEDRGSRYTVLRSGSILGEIRHLIVAVEKAYSGTRAVIYGCIHAVISILEHTECVAALIKDRVIYKTIEKLAAQRFVFILIAALHRYHRYIGNRHIINDLRLFRLLAAACAYKHEKCQKKCNDRNAFPCHSSNLQYIVL